MNQFDFMGAEPTPQDEWTKEIATFRINVPVDVSYFRKKNKDGGLFWSVASVGITRNGKKEYVDAASQDSKMIEKQIRAFLENRSWEKESSVFQDKPTSMDEVAAEGQLPF